MAKYYEVSHADVEICAIALGLPHPLCHALMERGWKQSDIDAMSGELRFREFCEWHGLIGWSDTLIAMVKASGA